ncbi:unnamed protein product, partial [Closterium sp. Naga37s-1]
MDTLQATRERVRLALKGAQVRRGAGKGEKGGGRRGEERASGRGWARKKGTREGAWGLGDQEGEWKGEGAADGGMGEGEGDGVAAASIYKGIPAAVDKGGVGGPDVIISPSSPLLPSLSLPIVPKQALSKRSPFLHPARVHNSSSCVITAAWEEGGPDTITHPSLPPVPLPLRPLSSLTPASQTKPLLDESPSFAQLVRVTAAREEGGTDANESPSFTQLVRITAAVEEGGPE